MSEKQRERIYSEAVLLASAGELWYTVEMASAKTIDRRGIAVVIQDCINQGLGTLVQSSSNLSVNRKVRAVDVSAKQGNKLDWGMMQVKLDGGLRAPAYCVHQETIIKGDAKEKVIGLASIMAKVTRDRYMRRVAKRPAYQAYDFARHKGYGTAAHRQAIATHGQSPEHRKSYCKNIKIVG